jgi:predicted ATPase
MAWIGLRPQERRIDELYQFVEKYMKRVDEIHAHTYQYLAAVNEFLADSRKKLAFAANGDLAVEVGNIGTRPVTALSSGESHLFVILTHLYFNPRRELASVLIIDEPELSLHIKWQEMFVNAVMAAQSDLQLILATHSPSIILDRESHCIDLSPKRA